MSDSITEGVDIPWPADNDPGELREEWQPPRTRPQETPPETARGIVPEHGRPDARPLDKAEQMTAFIKAVVDEHDAKRQRTALDPVRAWALRAAVEHAAGVAGTGLSWNAELVLADAEKFEMWLRGEHRA